MMSIEKFVLPIAIAALSCAGLIGPSQGLAATHVVDNTSDLDTPAMRACTVAPNDCSLRGATTRAQGPGFPGEDSIHFDIPASDPNCTAAGVCTITLGSSLLLSAVAEGLTFDGTTQPGASANALPLGQGSNAVMKIVLAGTPSGNLDLRIPVTLRGLVFQLPVSISLRGGLGGSPAGRYELFGNFFGLQADGSGTLASYPGVLLSTSISFGNIDGVRIGSADPADMNVFGAAPPASGLVECLRLSGSNHIVHGNLIGTDRSGLLPRGCTLGLSVSGTGMQIGGPNPGEGNVISGHVNHAIQFFSGAPAGSFTALLRGNAIGAGVDRATPVPNGLSSAFADLPVLRGDNGAMSVRIGGSDPGEGNLIAFNGLTRPLVTGPPDVSTPGTQFNGRWEIRGNRFLGNRGGGIDLSNTVPRLPNDVGDGDNGPGNKLQNFPLISAASLAGNQLQLTYKVDSAFSAAPAAGESVYPLVIEFYKADLAAGSDLLGRDTYLGSEAQQDKTITLTLPAGVTLGADDVIVATATDSPIVGTTAAGNTSEFSFYPLASFEMLPGTPTSVPAGVPFSVRVRAVAAPGVPFKPSGIVQFVNGTAPICEAAWQPTATPRTSEAECQLTRTGSGSFSVVAAHSATLSAFALANGFHPANVSTPSIALTPGIASLEIVAGNLQTAPVGEPFPLPLTVRALRADQTPMPGVRVDFSAPASGASASFAPAQVLTGADGTASTVATAIRRGGSYPVTARVGAITQVFTLTNEPGLDTALEILSNLPNPSNPGQPVAVAVALNPQAGAPVAPTGAVAVSANTGESCTIPLPASSCQLVFATLGERVIQAFYPGDESFRSSKAAFVDHNVVPAPTLSINDVALNEGDSGSTAFVFTVSLEHATGAPVSVDFASANDSAVAPSDYTATNGTLNFSGATVTQTLAVQVNGDSDFEPDEQFLVNLGNATGAVIGKPQGIGRILNDDQAPPSAASIDDAVVAEPTSPSDEVLARFRVRLDRPALAPFSVRVRTLPGTATPGVDFDANDFRVFFATGDSEAFVEVFIRHDALNEATETFSVELSEPLGLTIADGSATGTIFDAAFDGVLTVTSSADPGDGNCTPSECTLREAIALGNGLQSVAIRFDIPGPSVHQIRPLTPLPILGPAIHTIDGYSQPGSQGNTLSQAIEGQQDRLNGVLKLELDGSALGTGSHGLTLLHGATVRGLAIGNWAGSGIRIVTGAQRRTSQVAGNHVGTRADGLQAMPNGTGVEIVLNGAPATTTNVFVGSVGGRPTLARNLISGNRGAGIAISGDAAAANLQVRIEGNLVGLGAGGFALGNGGDGLLLTLPAANRSASIFSIQNAYAGNAGSGLRVSSSSEVLATAVGSFSSSLDRFGLADGGLPAANGRHAMELGGAAASVQRIAVSQSLIGAHPEAAVRIQGAQTEVSVLPTRLPQQVAAIDLGVLGATPNDPGDGDLGPNGLLNTPLLAAAVFNDRGDRVRVDASLDTAVLAGASPPEVILYQLRDGNLLRVGSGRLDPSGGGFAGQFEIGAGAQLRVGSELLAMALYAGVNSELSTLPFTVTGVQALASSSPVREGAGVLARVTIALGQPPAAPISLNWHTRDGSAGAGSDYVAAQGQVTLTPASPTAEVDIGILNDALVEADEDFLVEVSSATNFGIGTAVARVVIVDDDRLRQDRGQFDPLELTALDGRNGFRIEHPRAPVAARLLGIGNFDGLVGDDLALSSGSDTWLLPNLSAPFAASVVVPPTGSASTPRISGASLIQWPSALGRLRGTATLPSIGLLDQGRAVIVHGRAAPLPPSSTLNSLIVVPTGYAYSDGTTPSGLLPIGDINGDGRLDFAVQQGGPGPSVVFGTAGTIPALAAALDGSNGFVLRAGVNVGLVQAVGDVNGDGHADILVRYSRIVGGSAVTGNVLLLGRSTWPATVNLPADGLVLNHPLATEDVRVHAGDFNGDGFGDLVVIPRFADDGYLQFGNGSPGGLNNIAQRTSLNSLRFGRVESPALAVLADTDGNGIADLAIASGDQRVALLYGRRQWPAQVDLRNPPPQTVKFLIAPEDMHGVAAAGDLNGDGLSDLAIGGRERSYVVFGSEELFFGGAETAPAPAPGEPAFVSTGTASAEIAVTGASLLNVELLPAGRVDGDSVPDLLVGERAGSLAAVALIPGAVLNAQMQLDLQSLPTASNRFRRTANSAGLFSIDHAAAGDFDGDGRADLAFLSSSRDRVAIVSGRSGAMPGFIDPFSAAPGVRIVMLAPAAPADALAVTGLGDIDGDGLADIGVLRGNASARQLDIVFGGTGTLRRASVTAPAAMQPLQLPPRARLGRIQSGGIASDSFTLGLGDGRHAVVFGNGAFPATLNLGGLLNQGMLLSASHWRGPGSAILAGLGDLDGDGVAELGIAHAPPSSDGRPQGRIEILKGRASFPNTLNVASNDPALIQGRVLLRGTLSVDVQPGALDALVDRNGDGRRELLVSLPQAEGDAIGVGRALLIHGFALPAGSLTLREIEVPMPAGQGVRLLNGRRSDGLNAGRVFGDLDGDGREELLFGSDIDGAGSVRTGLPVLIRGSALPQ